MVSVLSNLLISHKLYMGLSIACVIAAALCALFIVVVILLQPGNSDGVSALGGASDTFYGHNKSKTIEHKLKILTAICIGIIMLCMVSFFILALI